MANKTKQVKTPRELVPSYPMFVEAEAAAFRKAFGCFPLYPRTQEEQAALTALPYLLGTLTPICGKPNVEVCE